MDPISASMLRLMNKRLREIPKDPDSESLRKLCDQCMMLLRENNRRLQMAHAVIEQIWSENREMWNDMRYYATAMSHFQKVSDQLAANRLIKPEMGMNMPQKDWERLLRVLKDNYDDVYGIPGPKFMDGNEEEDKE